mmetsp:Transcript_28961/g.37343  ORF Transcript_28961/g.37343 Transcript_28961/m.37343 type:complete len:712 (-) Transcript_28961:330-2465(-)|eukprot:CAMPEP_0117761698 /NCGR_PEP_ID=MMETSP0947-20121206/17445_1 /TAXON_ID=44440 /ORGANISM="Chattonella subsalsa, Strain CCMP2191" /LENGTH=711 /DNA_ID=CAMNT_0005582759 /DNA_START=163 /DNA_END=2298 /DNA_ORIENTATION=-
MSSSLFSFSCSDICKQAKNPESCTKLCSLIQAKFNELDPECQEGVSKLSQDPVKLSEAAYTSANVPLALSILVQTTANDTTQAAEAIQFVTYGSISNLGDPDACKSIPDMHYCLLGPASAEILSASQPLPIKLGACLPDQCFHEITDLPLGDGANVLRISCGDRQKHPTDEAGSVVMLTLCGVLLFLVALGTILETVKKFCRRVLEEKMNEKPAGYLPLEGSFGDVVVESAVEPSTLSEVSLNQTEVPYHNNQGSDKQVHVEKGAKLWERLLLCFALGKNLESLLTTKRPESFKCFDGIRFFSMCWVIFGHTVVFQFAGAGFSNIYDILPLHGHGFFTRFTAMVLPSAEFAVDTFFYISGFLVAVLTLKRLKEKPPQRGPWVWVPLAYLHRYIRLTPTLMFVAFFQSFVVILIGNGPFWDGIMADHDLCLKYWWKNMLYINNTYFNQSCYAVAWYLAVDFQMFLVAPFVLLLYKKNRRWGIGALVALCIAGIAWGWAVAEAYDLSFNTFSPTTMDYFDVYYSKPWTRCPPYIIGMLTAILWYEKVYLPQKMFEKQTHKLSIQQTLVWGSISAALMGVTVYGCWTDYRDMEPSWGTFEDHAYLALSKPAWSVGLAIMCYLCFLNQGGVVQDILEAQIFVPLSRLCFTAYLAHPIVLYTLYNSRVSKLHFTTIEYTFTFLGATTGAILLAAGFYLLVERPCLNLDKICLKKFL